MGMHLAGARRLQGLMGEFARAASGDPPNILLRKARSVGLARLYLRHCTQVGCYAKVYGRPRIVNRGTLMIGQHVGIWSTIVPSELLVFEGAKLEIGEFSLINCGTSIAATGSVHIGHHCLLGMYTIIFDNDFHELERRFVRPEPRPVVLEDNVWLGHRTMVLPGVTIGHDSVIAAGSVVMTDIPPRCMAVGNPARVVRTL